MVTRRPGLSGVTGNIRGQSLAWLRVRTNVISAKYECLARGIGENGRPGPTDATRVFPAGQNLAEPCSAAGHESPKGFHAGRRGVGARYSASVDRIDPFHFIWMTFSPDLTGEVRSGRGDEPGNAWRRARGAQIRVSWTQVAIGRATKHMANNGLPGETVGIRFALP